MPYKAAEFFAGIGLVRFALERRGWQVVFANDIDPDKLEMYEANFGRDHYVLGDIHDLTSAQIPACDLFTASFPCNDLSVAGSQDGLNGRQSSAYWGLINILKNLNDRRPPLVLLENVVGFLQANRGKDFETALLALNDLGYVVDAFIINAVHWVPQSRARLFVVARQASPTRSCTLLMESEVRPPALNEFICAHQNISWDICDLPALPRGCNKISAVIENLPAGHPAWWDEKRAEYFFNQLSDRHKTLADSMIAADGVSFATAFRRIRKSRSMAELRADGIAGCLRTPRGGSGRQILFQAGRGVYAVRLLTARECARLQGVPDSYEIPVSENKALFGFGDAVCVPVIEWVVDNYLTPAMNTFRMKLDVSASA